MEYVNHDHNCYWTRRRRTRLTRHGRCLSGAGIPVAVLQHAASALDMALKVRPMPDNEYNDEVRIGDYVGYLHDACFMSFEEPSAELEAALLSGVCALLAGYLGRESAPIDASEAIRTRLREGWSVEIQAIPREASLRIRAFPAEAGWWTRAFSPRLTLRADRV